MALKVKNADGTIEYIKGAGAGTSGDPHVLERTIAGVPTTVGQKARAASAGVTLSTEDAALLADLLTSTAFAARIGEVQAAPTANTVLARLKDLLTGIILAASENHIGEVGNNILPISTEFTRPSNTTAYTAGDSVSDSTSSTTMQALANAARVSGGSGYITGVRVTTDKKSITPRIRVHFFKTNGATLSADNAAWQSRYADDSKYVGWADLPPMTTGTDTTNSTESRAQDLTLRIPYICAATTLYFVLEALDAFTPANAEKFTVTVFCSRN